MTQLGTRDQVQVSIDYTKDALDIAADVFRNTDLMATMERWGGVLAGVDVWAVSHCDRLLAYLRVD